MNPTTLIIGGTRGIGKVISSVLQAEQHIVWTASRRENTGNHVLLNLENSENYKNLKLPKKINNVVFSHRYRGNHLEKEFNVNLIEIIRLTEFLIPRIKTNGSIVFLGSPAANLVFSEQSVSYHIIKNGIEILTKYFAVKFGEKKIRFNSIMPGTIVKPENKNFFRKGSKERKIIEKYTPLQRIGTAKDVAFLVSFLLSARSTFLTGQSIYVDGGISLLGQDSLIKKFKDR